MTLARQAESTVTFIDEYCQQYQQCFPDVRSFEQFTYLHVGMLSEIKRKTLPAIAKAVGKTDAQALHHFLANAPWSVEAVRERRLHLIHDALHERPFTLCIDETGDEKKGHTTDYVAHQYIGNLGKLANGAVSVNAYGMLDNITFPLLFSIYKPQTRLQTDDAYTLRHSFIYVVGEYPLPMPLPSQLHLVTIAPLICCQVFKVVPYARTKTPTCSPY